jgi:hypothetical protein
MFKFTDCNGDCESISSDSDSFISPRPEPEPEEKPKKTPRQQLPRNLPGELYLSDITKLINQCFDLQLLLGSISSTSTTKPLRLARFVLTFQLRPWLRIVIQFMYQVVVRHIKNTVKHSVNYEWPATSNAMQCNTLDSSGP